MMNCRACGSIPYLYDFKCTDCLARMLANVPPRMRPDAIDRMTRGYSDSERTEFVALITSYIEPEQQRVAV